MKHHTVWLLAAFGAAFFMAGCQPEEPKHKLDHERRSQNIEDVRPDPSVIYGDEVFVLARRGMGGKATDRATYGFALEARKQCGIRFEVESRSTDSNPWSEWITHAAVAVALYVAV